MEIRLLNGEERLQAMMIAAVAFHQRLDDLEKAKQKIVTETVQQWGAFHEDGTLMAHIINNQFTSWLDGTPVRNGGIGAVSTLPEYRMEGGIKGIFRKLLPYAYADGEVISTLYPFNHAFYRKFGYKTVCWKNIYEFSPDVLREYTFTGEAKLWKQGDPVTVWTELYNRFASSWNLALRRDDALMENFFGLMKTEMFYGQERSYTSVEELIQAMHDYIHYFNNDRIKVRLKGLTPMEYRNQALRIT